MSLLVEIATRADVSLEAVVRVLTREPVSDEAKARVLAVLDDLEPEQTRVLQRFALAAVHDELPRPAEDIVEEDVFDVDVQGVETVGENTVEEDAVDEDMAEEDVGEEVTEPALGPAVSAALEPSQAALPAAPASVSPLVQLGPVLGDLADAVRELRRETDAERRERVDDLAVLIDLITKGWEGLDRRLGRLERQLTRLEGAEPRRTLPMPIERPIERPPVPTPPEPEPPPPPPDGNGRSAFRGRLPLVAVLGLGIGVGAVAALDLPERSNVSSVVSASTNDSAALPPRTATQPTSSVLGEVVPPATARQTPPASRKPAPTTSAASPTTATRKSAAPTPTPTPPATTTARPTGFRPSRNWAWPPTAGADYYLVEFFRDGRVLYRTRATAAQLTLPEAVVFTPGSYRWRVRPGHGAPGANDLDPAIVDSAFTVGG